MINPIAMTGVVSNVNRNANLSFEGKKHRMSKITDTFDKNAYLKSKVPAIRDFYGICQNFSSSKSKMSVEEFLFSLATCIEDIQKEAQTEALKGRKIMSIYEEQYVKDMRYLSDMFMTNPNVLSADEIIVLKSAIREDISNLLSSKHYLT